VFCPLYSRGVEAPIPTLSCGCTPMCSSAFSRAMRESWWRA